MRRGRRKLYVHVGQAKTGSSSIQSMLDRLSPALERSGMHVVTTAAVAGNHRWLTTAQDGDRASSHRAARARCRALVNEVRRCRAASFVVSAEEFSSPRGRMPSVRFFAAVAEAANLEVEVVACVRPQWQWMEAAWTQGVWSGEVVLPFARWWAAKGFDDERLDYARVFAPWREAFGRMSLIPLDQRQLPDGLLARFLEVLEIDDDALRAAARGLARINARRGAQDVEVRRLVMAALQRRGATPAQRRRATWRLAGLEKLLAGDRPFAGWTVAQIEVLERRFAPRNARFASEFGLDAEAGCFGATPADGRGRPNVAAWTDLGTEEQRTVGQFVVRRLGVRLPDDEAAAAWTTGQGASADARAHMASLAGHGARTVVLRASTRCADVLRGLREARRSLRGLSLLRWLRWRANGLLWEARYAGRRLRSRRG